ncbi:DnaJ domain-containing protein [Abyssalbus ytuae]|uniref:DnaJ domain-containing protein n=1 Tax=Abyssalbus ytuae TaxID=2926907 RepID=A0A9E6ZZD5_9FLAO|nr:DnaJ domain-containing protein [Abyssalbus ytuae]UOB16656.1 DnaJ domain-containing protein [Abyssalbus ytuae]
MAKINYEKKYYEILGVKPTSDDDDIKKAYKKAALRYHPDRNQNNLAEATEKFKEIGEAYEILSDPETRKNYDRGRRHGSMNPTYSDPTNIFQHFAGPSGFSQEGKSQQDRQDRNNAKTNVKSENEEKEKLKKRIEELERFLEREKIIDKIGKTRDEIKGEIEKIKNIGSLKVYYKDSSDVQSLSSKEEDLFREISGYNDSLKKIAESKLRIEVSLDSYHNNYRKEYSDKEFQLSSEEKINYLKTIEKLYDELGKNARELSQQYEKCNSAYMRLNEKVTELETQRMQTERQEKEREKLERERQGKEREKLEKERQGKEREKQERERQERERQEKERQEKEREKQERERQEKEKERENIINRIEKKIDSIKESKLLKPDDFPETSGYNRTEAEDALHSVTLEYKFLLNSDDVQELKRRTEDRLMYVEIEVSFSKSHPELDRSISDLQFYEQKLDEIISNMRFTNVSLETYSARMNKKRKEVHQEYAKLDEEIAQKTAALHEIKSDISTEGRKIMRGLGVLKEGEVPRYKVFEGVDISQVPEKIMEKGREFHQELNSTIEKIENDIAKLDKDYKAIGIGNTDDASPKFAKEIKDRIDSLKEKIERAGDFKEKLEDLFEEMTIHHHKLSPKRVDLLTDIKEFRESLGKKGHDMHNFTESQVHMRPDVERSKPSTKLPSRPLSPHR